MASPKQFRRTLQLCELVGIKAREGAHVIGCVEIDDQEIDQSSQGQVIVGAHSTVNLQGVLNGGQVDFTGYAGQLILGDVPGFSAAINGFVDGDTIDLQNFRAASVSYDGQFLNFYDSSSNLLAQIAVNGDYSDSTFNLASDNNGGGYSDEPPF